ncbi:hypothetical protein UAW_02576 [Enterococcus haemoperoxidus ATCC BAA-382]|uniref:Lipoprotein n=1 Tax=Enterococcus haemoperoxidus ATCC BAA-382 TaxID=1158608 RepID=R2QDN6_9ENTE|nr:hypothetical protein [Enterococcus haemoperoxidus]EOH93328.1 hypothetical protein UAW_02576 [Enterococcus haemoperoxidus ATCC BAA-382]EOT61282.1 hypothetical protein I583_00260 [Enterococcus haemoperoxidus ATCC BAA-382]
MKFKQKTILFLSLCVVIVSASGCKNLNNKVTDSTIDKSDLVLPQDTQKEGDVISPSSK